MPVWVVDRKRWNPALWSRYAHPVLADTLRGPSFMGFLRDLQSRIGEQPFLVITDELALLTISEHRTELEGLYHFRLPAHDTVLMLHDKARFHESAWEHGWPVPNGVVVRNLADIRKITSLRLPMILKPADKRHFHEGHAPRLITADNYADALSAAGKLLAQAGEVLVQETIEGPDDNIYFCLFYRGRNGETLGAFTGQKLASTPPGTGSTAFCTAAVNEELGRTTKDFLDQVNYFGFGGVEYKRDPRSGRFLIIEPTVGRTDWQEEAATLAGVNIPLTAYRHELDLQPLPAGPVDGGVVWQDSWIERIRFGAKPIPPLSVVVDGYWRRDDPLPALVHYPHNVAHAVASYLRRWLAGQPRRLDKADYPTWSSSKL
ncbi:carboxylate--amine ligase [Mesorhizobium sp. WSM4313]|uniref:carboxylate--amine ligase n=1 Tax=Mesorhizobium sp. WSM4313 TaxID=2029412 RepID=UPI000BB0742A|nr:carboxylate--amine ligase [Mesorhizobium sp. WSM4313]PBB16811.1 carboxylate--amine ligase [Mesorhizobium sp. WSM4313]